MKQKIQTAEQKLRKQLESEKKTEIKSPGLNQQQKMALIQEELFQEERLEKLKASAANVEAFIEKAKRYRTIDELTPQIVRLFISRIEVGERAVKHSRHSAQKIRIVYRNIGEWDHDEAAAETNRQQPQLTADAAHLVLLPA